MPVRQNTIAIIFDFDDTLTDDSISVLLSAKGVDVDSFWINDVASLVREGWDPPLAYMRRLLELTQPGKALEGLTCEELQQCGPRLTPYHGLRTFFNCMTDLVRSEPKWRGAGIHVEFFIISGGLEEIINNAPFRRYFRDAWGSSFYCNPKTGVIEHPRNVVSFTEKTRFLFQINKGIVGPDSRENPDKVNKKMDLADRPIPFAHMIYIGDGLTDIPCFSVVEGGGRERKGGFSFGIYHPDRPDKDRRREIAWNLMVQRRTDGLYRPDYRKRSGLRDVIELAVQEICDDIALKNVSYL